jgi:hypothetical protein
VNKSALSPQGRAIKGRSRAPKSSAPRGNGEKGKNEEKEEKRGKKERRKKTRKHGKSLAEDALFITNPLLYPAARSKPDNSPNSTTKAAGMQIFSAFFTKPTQSRFLSLSIVFCKFWAHFRPLRGRKPGYPLQSFAPLPGGAQKYFRSYPLRNNAREPVSVSRR